jgi:hypothetical protein
MASSWHPTVHRPAGWRALLAYIAGWLAVGAIAAAGVIALMHDGDPEISLPPVQETELARAADRADCRLRRGGQPAAAKPRVEGPRERPVRAGIYGADQPEGGLVGALRRGTVVIAYRPGLSEASRQQLEELQRAVPRGTIVAPDRDLPYAVAVTAWRRLLGCDRVAADTVDAIRLFHGRYVGSGPDTPR